MYNQLVTNNAAILALHYTRNNFRILREFSPSGKSAKNENLVKKAKILG